MKRLTALVLFLTLWAGCLAVRAEDETRFLNVEYQKDHNSKSADPSRPEKAVFLKIGYSRLLLYF